MGLWVEENGKSESLSVMDGIGLMIVRDTQPERVQTSTRCLAVRKLVEFLKEGIANEHYFGNVCTIQPS